MRRPAGENFDSVNPKGVPAAELIARNYKPRKSGTWAQRRAVLAVRNKNLLSSESRVELSQGKYYLIAVRGCYFDILELTDPIGIALNSCTSEQVP
jgi:hypothetical protein